MTAATVRTDAVLLVDLREETGDQVDTRLWEILHNYRIRESSRVLVVDDAATLADHDSVFETLLGSRRIRAVVCVAVGPPLHPGSGPVLQAPGSLNVDGAATLWVGDRDGVGWDIVHGMAVAPDEVDMPDQPSLRTLLDVLRVPEVFDAVAGMASDFPGRTANPGMLAEASPIGPDELVAAQATAMQAVAGPGRHPAFGQTPAPEEELRTVLLGGPDRRLANIVREPASGSTTDRLFHSGLDACRRATGSVEALAGPIGPALIARSDAAELVARAGEAIGECRRFVADLFGRMGGRVGLDQAQHESLRRVGLNSEPPPDTDRHAIAARMQETVEKALASGHSLDALRGRLRRISEQAAPMGSGAHLEELDRRCPAAMVNNLAQPPAFPLRLVQPWVLAAVAGCGLLAGLLHWVATAVLAILWVAGLLLALDRRPGQPAEWLAPVVAAVVVNALAVAAGGAVAAWLRSGVGVPVPIGVASAVAAVAALTYVLRRWWRGAVRRWVAGIGIAQASDAVLRVRQLLMDVVVREWAMTEARRFTADAAARMANHLTAAATLLNERAAEYARPSGTGQRPTRWAPGGPTAVPPQLVEIMVADLVDAVRSALRPCWEQLRFGGYETDANVRQRLAELLDDYRAHLQVRGVDQAPSFATGTVERSTIAGTMWQGSRLVGRLVRQVSAGELMLQMCSVDDLSVLSASLSGTRLVRFAPQAVQSALATGLASAAPGTDRDLSGLADLVWTGSTQLAGALRLVPLRDSAVELVWSQTSNDEPDAPGTASGD